MKIYIEIYVFSMNTTWKKKKHIIHYFQLSIRSLMDVFKIDPWLEKLYNSGYTFASYEQGQSHLKLQE